MNRRFLKFYLSSFIFFGVVNLPAFSQDMQK